MKVFRLPDRLLADALSLPEIAMGHQEVLAAFRSQEQEMGYLVVGRYFVPAQRGDTAFGATANYPPIQYIDTSPPSIIPFSDSATYVHPSIKVIPHENGRAMNVTAAMGALPPFATKTEAVDVFYRISPFNDDLRITADGAVVAQTYATTETDLPMAPSGLAAVGRYALPSRLPAMYCFEIRPPVGTEVAYGTVTPRYGLAGGGVEAYFPKGCEKGSVKRRFVIPMK